MLSGYFENCYGIKQFSMPHISFEACNKAIIYAPNGVMKTSFAKVFEDISKGTATSDRIFINAISRYSVTHYTSNYQYSSEGNGTVPHSENIYVINSFADKFEFNKESVGTLLADEATRNEYNVIMSQFSDTLNELLNKLKELTNLTKPKIKAKLIDDLQLPSTADWPDIIDAVGKIKNQHIEFLSDIFYSDLFNDKAMTIYSDNNFKKNISEYVENLEYLLQNSPLLNKHFTERSAEELTKSLSSYNLFEAKHKILLRNGTQINNLNEWKRVVQQQLNELYQTPALAGSFGKLKRLFSKNADTAKVRDIIVSHRGIIPYLQNIPSLKLQTWCNCFNRLEKSFSEYSETVTVFKERIRELYEKAAAQSERWTEVVREFNLRFRVPFTANVKNKSNFILKDEAPNIEFEYKRVTNTGAECVELSKDELMHILSMGERRALYLLYILFDLERIKKRAREGAGHFLIIADDISDSFDYKNKYSIIEYLSDLAETQGIDLLVLTHNFDFYRTVMLRCKIDRSNCYISQRNAEGIVNMTVFRYQRDFFKNVIHASIQNGDLDSEDKKKCLISSIPFYRNLAEYSGSRDIYLKLTCCLHFKTTPFDTSNIMISDIWKVIKPYLNNVDLRSTDQSYMQLIKDLATNILQDNDEVSLENKLVLSIAARLQIEKFMKAKIILNEGTCLDATDNQTKEWFSKAAPYLTNEEKEIIEEINLVTPESIHLNAFMYEPLIDTSSWNLKELYHKSTLL